MKTPKFKIGQRVMHWNKNNKIDYFTISGMNIEKDFKNGEPYYMYSFKEFSQNFFMNEDQLHEVVNS